MVGYLFRFSCRITRYASTFHAQIIFVRHLFEAIGPRRVVGLFEAIGPRRVVGLVDGIMVHS